MYNLSQTTSVTRNGAWEMAMKCLSAATELNYLTMIVCRVFEIHSENSSTAGSYCTLSLNR
jgi:hypothetical protein